MFSSVLSHNVIKQLTWSPFFNIRMVCTTGERDPCFCYFYPGGHLNTSQSKTKTQEIQIKSIQNTWNIKGARLQTGATDCTRVTSAQRPTSHRSAMLHSAGRGHSNRHWEEEVDGRICSGSVCFSELWLMGLIPVQHCQACGSFFLTNHSLEILSDIVEQAQATGFFKVFYRDIVRMASALFPPLFLTSSPP